MIPPFLETRIDDFLHQQLEGGKGLPTIDFAQPRGEPALIPADSVSWRVFANPLSLYVGGIAAVLLELAEPRVRTGVWEHTTFRTDPLLRMRRTAIAAMVTVYGPRSVAEPMIARVRQMHGRIRGETPAGVPYHANDPELLRWVHATALLCFMDGYHRFVRPLSASERDRFVAEGAPVARLYGAKDPPTSDGALQQLIATTLPQLEPSGIILEFLGIVRRLNLFPPALRPLNGLVVRAAVDLLPASVREVLGLGGRLDPPPGATRFLRLLGSQLDALRLESSPAFQSRRRIDPK